MKCTLLLLSVFLMLAGCAPSSQSPAVPSPLPPVITDPVEASGDTAPATNEVDVFYGTNRQALAGDCRFSGARSSVEALSYGKCRVSFPPDHRVGIIESPFFDWMKSNPDDHVMIKNGRRLDREQFNQSLALRLGERGASLIFIHGYNVSFEDSVKRTAQLAYDLQFKGAPLLFSWPSSGSESQYRADESAIAQSYPAVYDFLKDHLENPGVKKVYIVAHSMGNRALTQALLRLYSESPDLAAKLQEVVLAAPDIDAGEFADKIVPELRRQGAPVTLYVSANDKALALSQVFHGAARAGMFRKPVVIYSGVELIDASALSTDFIGHSYYGDKLSVVADMYYLFKGAKAADRFNLQVVTAPGGQYWEFKP